MDTSILTRIQSDVQTNQVMLYMKVLIYLVHRSQDLLLLKIK